MIEWSTDQRGRVAEIFEHYPPHSARCATAAKELLPTAREIDRNSRAMKVSPRVGLYVAPRTRVGGTWFHHVTVDVSVHYVDALTGPDGREHATYLEHYFKHPESHRIEPVSDDALEAL